MSVEQCVQDMVQKILPHVEGEWDSLNIDADLSQAQPDVIVAYVEAESKVTLPLPDIPELQPLVAHLVELEKDDGRGECIQCLVSISRDGSIDLQLNYEDEAGDSEAGS